MNTTKTMFQDGFRSTIRSKTKETQVDDPYVVSEERLAEIRAMFTIEGIQVVPTVSADLLAWAIYDLLAERDEKETA